MKKPLATLGALGLGAALWGHFEAGWVRLRSIPVPIPGLPEELDGLRVVHLSDFHLGFPSRGEAPSNARSSGRPRAIPIWS